ncbi:MAG: hypothetical protein PHI73_04450 [Patescibacteria group bacterium]|nr:hypothetical protein [Patescibacteria group bacterium]
MNERGQENPIEREGGGIETATSFDELYVAIRAQGKIVGSREEYEPEEIIDLIEGVRLGGIRLNYVTRSNGIRDAVRRLLQVEKPGE